MDLPEKNWSFAIAEDGEEMGIGMYFIEWNVFTHKKSDLKQQYVTYWSIMCIIMINYVEFLAKKNGVEPYDLIVLSWDCLLGLSR